MNMEPDGIVVRNARGRKRATGRRRFLARAAAEAPRRVRHGQLRNPTQRFTLDDPRTRREAVEDLVDLSSCRAVASPDNTSRREVPHLRVGPRGLASDGAAGAAFLDIAKSDDSPPTVPIEGKGESGVGREKGPPRAGARVGEGPRSRSVKGRGGEGFQVTLEY
jgi:hypothetical protein